MKEKEKQASLSDAQMEIMNIIWDAGEATVAEVWGTLSEKKKVARNTVQTTMTRLEEKGWLKHRTRGNTFYYSAARERSRTLKNMVSQMVDTAFAGSAGDMVMALLDGKGISSGDAEKIREMIKRAEREGK